MTLLSYYLGRKHYPIPYDLKRIGIYLSLTILLFISSLYLDLGMYVNTLYLVAFIVFVIALERPKKRLNSTPE
jgi:hypothetical protein